MSALEWRDTGQTILARVDGNHTEIIEAGHPEWATLSMRNDIEPHVVPAPPAPRIPVLTFAQLLIGLVAEGWITEPEGDAWATGTALPASVLGVVGSLPEAHRFPARARLYRMTAAHRNDPLVADLAASQGKTAAEVDAFFTTYAA